MADRVSLAQTTQRVLGVFAVRVGFFATVIPDYLTRRLFNRMLTSVALAIGAAFGAFNALG